MRLSYRLTPLRLGAERCACRVDHNMALRARFAAIRRVRASGSAPFLAATVQDLSEARLQSGLPASAKRSSRVRCERAHTPTVCQSRSRRQHVMPEQPISAGSISQGMPLRRTKMMPASAARSSTIGRPPLGLASSGGRSGSIAQRALAIRGLARPNERTHPGFC